MKKSNLAYRILCAATATAMFALPLLACTDDDELHGVEVTKQEWENRVSSYYVCQNYTEKSETYENGELTSKAVIMVDIDKHGVVYMNDTVKNRIEYIFCEPIDSSTSYWGIKIYKDDDKEWSIEDMNTCSVRRINKYFAGVTFTAQTLNVYGKYSDFKYDKSNGSYYRERTNNIYDPDDESIVLDSYTEKLKAYFSDKYLFAGSMEMKSENSITTAKSVCSDFGKTVVKVPADVKALADEYIATHEPPVIEEEW